ncbi:hypothetical protein ACO22_01082 [Paracoccidioides brasiliensis]|uniref:Uncharacterized protein n=1 Tax=Paracoccidioides brasiliensis TaxID=121759 RepID=A0A1D2JMI0_PARBR|nr:hypothetical protein ACO22_01082 [Paracoccidioides brasiliensis]
MGNKACNDAPFTSKTFDPLSTARGCQGLDCLLRDLSKIIPGNMKMLHTFSLRINHEPLALINPENSDVNDDTDVDRIRAEPGFSAFVLISLLASLPETCTNLEIDTSGFEVYSSGDHLCPHIAKLLPNLTHLRLRIRQLCSGLINLSSQSSCPQYPGVLQPALCPKLRSLIINMELSSVLQGGMSRCPLPPAPSPSRSTGKEIHTETDLQTDLSLQLLVCLKRKNYFPVCERMEINNPIYLGVPPWHHIRQTDIKNCKTNISSFIPLPSYIEGVWKRGTHRCFPPALGTARAKTGAADSIIISPWSSHTREHTDNAWLSTSEGASFPNTTDHHMLSVFDANDYHMLRVDDEDRKKYPYHCSLAAYTKEMTSRWRNETRRTAESHPIYRELCEVDVSDLMAQTYHTLRLIPCERFTFPEPLPEQWYNERTRFSLGY